MGGILLFSPTLWVGSRGGEEGHTQEHTQERTRECCTYPLATYPLKSARNSTCSLFRCPDTRTDIHAATVSKRAPPTVSKKAPAIRRKLPNTIDNKQLNCKQDCSNCRQISCIHSLPQHMDSHVVENSRMLWRSPRRKSRSVPEFEADFAEAIFLPGKFPTLARIALRAPGKSGRNCPDHWSFLENFHRIEVGKATAFLVFLNCRKLAQPQPRNGEIHNLMQKRRKRDFPPPLRRQIHMGVIFWCLVIHMRIKGRSVF